MSFLSLPGLSSHVFFVLQILCIASNRRLGSVLRIASRNCGLVYGFSVSHHRLREKHWASVSDLINKQLVTTLAEAFQDLLNLANEAC